MLFVGACRKEEPQLLGTNISLQKGTLEDDFPFPQVGLCFFTRGYWVVSFFFWKLSPLSGEVTQFHYSTIFQRVLTTNKFSHGTCTLSNSEGQSIIQNVHCLGSGVNFWWCKFKCTCIAILIWFLGSWSMSPNYLSWQLIIVYFVFVIIPSPRYM